MRPLGCFVHHQGRGHAERCAALVHALPPERPVTLFCARAEIFPPLPANAEVVSVPSLFEATGAEAPGLADLDTPDTLHCAPAGWPGIREAMGTIAQWFREADPALMICDVSAEIAQLSRICSVPHVKVVQHGDRSDPGHVAAYRGALGLLAPCHADLAQPDWPGWMTAKTHFAGGLGIAAMPDRAAARARLGIAAGEKIALVVSGGGGSGFAQAPIGVGARALPDWSWHTIGHVERDWHATEPGNLAHHGWVDDAADRIAAADLVIASTGNTTCHQILGAGVPWIAVPEWRYFDEQHRKAEALSRAGVAHAVPHLPSSAQAWRAAAEAALMRHDPERMHALVDPRAAARAADWIETLIARAWGAEPRLALVAE
ncbi:glycosyltransferase [Limimaricola pyoseonensis]|uniref:Glycosyl transferases group 1 n=1 Tax=Limimaricola pyoseonensis TaxID=521013 RepID=A0A1G7J423_9RHOB|nr:glycosyltransferase [Limimaricola pyoseonensis]SDF19598.1 Glycosyl transferases group 1 [Limimaricola pyoseonensis]